MYWLIFSEMGWPCKVLYLNWLLQSVEFIAVW